jgi:trehalose-6-phosphate synthase
LALWSQSDIILCSSLNDGFCLQVLEYVVCRKMKGKQAESIMMCSEFAGCHEAMSGVLKYNPFSLYNFVETLDKAMCLTSEEKQERMD